MLPLALKRFYVFGVSTIIFLRSKGVGKVAGIKLNLSKGIYVGKELRV